MTKPLRVLITGACGFIGHHVARAMVDAGHEVVALDCLDETSSLDRLRDFHDHERFRFVWHDLKSPINDLVASLLGDINAIFHLAASTHVDRSIQNSMPFVLDNVVGTGHLLEYARSLPDLVLLLNFSTDEVFGPAPEGVAYKENDRYDPRNPYSATKAAAVELAHAYANTYGLPVITTHCMNVFGERQHPEKFVPLIIRLLLLDAPVQIHASPDKTALGSRFYIHAGAVASLMVQILDRVRGHEWLPPDKLNIPGEREVDNLALARMVADCVGKKLHYQLVDFHSTRPGHDLRYALDGEKIEKLGFSMPSSFADSLRATVSWYLANRNWLLL
jgi:dTDP-glucose 4,6-dehydratase